MEPAFVYDVLVDQRRGNSIYLIVMTVSSIGLVDLQGLLARKRLPPLCRLTPGQTRYDRVSARIVACR